LSGSDSGLVPSLESVLDKLEQVPPEDSGNAIETGVKITLRKRARSKYVTNIVARPLAELKSPLQKAYKLSTSCAGELVEKPGKITAMYCGCRWCIVCSRIRTGKLINGYMPAIEAMADKWFLTLSRPNVVGANLETEIKHYLREASLIQRHLREKRKLEFSSLRKIECTYNEEVKTYHPHFHYIFDSWEAANATLQEWLARNPTAKLNKGNLLKKADNNSVKELFKYFTKVASKTKSKAANGVHTSEYRIHLEALDRMFVAMRRVRTFQPCGVIKAVSEEVEPEQVLESGRAQVNQWAWAEHDWMNTETAAALTGYVPTASTRAIEGFVVYPETAPLTGYVDRETGEVLDLKYAPQLRNSMQYMKLYTEPDELPETRPGKLSSFAALNVSAVDWESQRQELEPVQPVLAVEPPAPAQLGLFAQPAAAPAAPKILSSPIKKPSSKKGLATAQAAPYFQAQTSESHLFALTG
jgi:hypothetical protein